MPASPQRTTGNMSQRNLVILTKIILIYSIFFIFMKAVVIFGSAWLVPNLLLMLPFLILGTVAGIQIKREKYSWWLVGIGAAAIIIIRVNETAFSVWVQQQLMNQV